MTSQFGMIGLGTMGSNMLMNMADHGIAVCGYDRSAEQQEKLREESNGRPVTVAATPEELVASLASPRIIMLLVPAGKIVDDVISGVAPLLEKGDILIDGGNSHYLDTDRRFRQLQGNGIHFVGMGVSGGEEGARLGASLMPGGHKESYDRIKNILEPVAAISDEGPCLSYIGDASAGHYTKMVHNGIEYAMMQLISEVYGLLKNAGGLSNAAIRELFNTWNQTELQSFLVEITADIFGKQDEDTGGDLIDQVSDKAKQKGTGMWTSQSAMELNVPIPTIDAAVTMRYLSSLKDERTKNAHLFPHRAAGSSVSSQQLATMCMKALHFGFLISYGQGLQLLNVASAQFDYGINVAEVLRVWKGGCIIRSTMLNELRKAYLADSKLSNIVSSPVFTPLLKEVAGHAESFVKTCIDSGLPCGAMAASLNYFIAYTSARLPANLIQAQRDYFGAHTYERVDKPGIFHSEWVDKPGVVTSAQKPKEE